MGCTGSRSDTTADDSGSDPEKREPPGAACAHQGILVAEQTRGDATPLDTEQELSVGGRDGSRPAETDERHKGATVAASDYSSSLYSALLGQNNDTPASVSLEVKREGHDNPLARHLQAAAAAVDTTAPLETPPNYRDPQLAVAVNDADEEYTTTAVAVAIPITTPTARNPFLAHPHRRYTPSDSQHNLLGSGPGANIGSFENGRLPPMRNNTFTSPESCALPISFFHPSPPNAGSEWSEGSPLSPGPMYKTSWSSATQPFPPMTASAVNSFLGELALGHPSPPPEEPAGTTGRRSTASSPQMKEVVSEGNSTPTATPTPIPINGDEHQMPSSVLLHQSPSTSPERCPAGVGRSPVNPGLVWRCSNDTFKIVPHSDKNWPRDFSQSTGIPSAKGQRSSSLDIGMVENGSQNDRSGGSLWVRPDSPEGFTTVEPDEPLWWKKELERYVTNEWRLRHQLYLVREEARVQQVNAPRRNVSGTLQQRVNDWRAELTHGASDSPDCVVNTVSESSVEI